MFSGAVIMIAALQSRANRNGVCIYHRWMQGNHKCVAKPFDAFQSDVY